MSLSQPHCPGSPPAESLSQNASTSSCVSQVTKSDMAGVKVKCGPPFKAMNRWPSSSNVTARTDPFGPGPASPCRMMLTIFAPLKIDM